MKISDFEIKRHNNFYYRGNWSGKVFKKSIAIVGSRRMTRYGRDVVDKFVSGFVVNGIQQFPGLCTGWIPRFTKKPLIMGE